MMWLLRTAARDAAVVLFLIAVVAAGFAAVFWLVTTLTPPLTP